MKIIKDRVTIEGSARDGYSTYFNYKPAVIRKEWWKYSREFGRPLNMKKYYKVTIPSEMNSGNVALELLSKTQKSGGGSKFFLAINEEHIPADKKATYQSQTKEMLLDFKQQYYIRLIQAKLEKSETSAAKLSKSISKSADDDSMIELMAVEQEMERLKNQLKEICVYR